MDYQTLVAILIFAFAVIALLGLGARSFTQLVELILSHGYKVDQLTQEIRQVQTSLSRGGGGSTQSHPVEDTLTTQENQSSH